MCLFGMGRPTNRSLRARLAMVLVGLAPTMWISRPARLVSSLPMACIIIWDIAARQKVHTLNHGLSAYAAKYSPQGDRIATASDYCVRVWDSDDRQLLVDVKVGLHAWYALVWFNNYLFVKTENSKIKQIDSSTGLTVSGWAVPHDENSWISLPQHGNFIAHSTMDNITFWDTSMHTQLDIIPQRSNSYPAFSPDNQIAITQGEKIVIQDLFLITVRPHTNKLPFLTIYKEPDIHIECAALHAWQSGQLTKAEVPRTAAIPRSKAAAHHVLASRASCPGMHATVGCSTR